VSALAELGVESYVIRLPRFGVKTAEILEGVVESIPVDKVDLIHIQHEYGLYVNLEGGFYGSLKQLGKPVITTLHAVGNWDVDAVIASASDRVIVHNRYCAGRVGREAKYPNVGIIPHGCKPTECPPEEECKRSIGVDPRASIVGYVGFISNHKGLETLIEAMLRVPDAALLVGGGWHVEAETMYITSLKERSIGLMPRRCQWLGYVPDERLSTTYGACKVIVYPSRFATESGALLMALSHGKAVLASRLKPFVEKEKEGALMTFTGVVDLTRKIRKLLKDEELRSRLERGARAYAETYSWPKMAQRHLNLYREVLEERKKL